MTTKGGTTPISVVGNSKLASSVALWTTSLETTLADAGVKAPHPAARPPLGVPPLRQALPAPPRLAYQQQQQPHRGHLSNPNSSSNPSRDLRQPDMLMPLLKLMLRQQTTWWKVYSLFVSMILEFCLIRVPSICYCDWCMPNRLPLCVNYYHPSGQKGCVRHLGERMLFF